jgi:rSAM-partnered protein
MEAPERSQVGEYPRDGTEVEWELFVRSETDGPLRHVGSVTAPDADIAYESGAKLFDRFANDIWVCRADDMHRFSTHTLDENASPAPIETNPESRSNE